MAESRKGRGRRREHWQGHGCETRGGARAMRRAAKHSTGNELPSYALAWVRDEEPRDGKGKRGSGEEMSGGGLDKQRMGFVKQRRGKEKQGRGYVEDSEGTEKMRNATAQKRIAMAQKSDAWSRTALA